MIKLLLLLSLPLAAQGTLGIVCPSTSAKPVICSIRSTATGATTLQWSITTNVANSGMVVRSLVFNKLANANGSKMLMFGMNALAIPTGNVATVSISFPASWKCPGNSPCLTVTLSDPQASVANHAANLTASPASATVRVPK